ncbi:D-aminoacyl-tRNA deacylase [Natronorarus salvus]|uniref:D-aminoacyl-tRNA deacylase n=1 Tax=Natronorarus salvus TaxID=3117733 RepID=UPI002F267B2B
MIAIVVSRADSASARIGEHLLSLADWDEREDDSCPKGDGGGTVLSTERFELREFDDWHLHLDGVASRFSDPDLLVFASRHSGETGPLLTAHHTGNFGEAEYGGRGRTLAEACPAAHHRVVRSLAEYAPEGYDVGIECTHHGPTDVGAPSMFVELGSGPDQWENTEAARAVAQAILDLEGARPHGDRTVVGFGGGHYAPRFTRIVRETPWAVGHVAADWSLSALGDPEENRDVIEATFERSGAELALFDGEHPDLREVIDSLGYRIVSETWLRETADRPRPLVDRVESELGRVDDGVRFGERASDAEVIGVLSLPGTLIERSRAVDAGAVRERVETHTVAFETEQSGTRIGERAAFAGDEDREDLVAALVSILAREYEIEHEGSVVTLRERAFDPALAREAGVREGPAFGRLAAGESVEVEGERIDPDRVHRERIERLSTE